jgi:hypothetical protein
MTAMPEYNVPRAEVTKEERVTVNEGLAGLVLGILAVLLALTPVLGLACGIVGLILAVKARARAHYHLGMASAGIVLSIIGIVLGTIATLAWVGAAFFGAAWFQGWLPQNFYNMNLGGGAPQR